VGLTLNSMCGGRRRAADALVDNVANEGISVLTGANAVEIEWAEGGAPSAQHRAAALRLEGGRRIRVRRELILCGGPVPTARLLLQSGVGDPAALAAAGRSTTIPAPDVGKYMYDHPTIFEPLLFTHCSTPSAVPKYQASAFDTSPDGHGAQLSVVTEQGFVAFAKLLGFDQQLLHPLILLLLRTLYRIAALLGWAYGNEPLAFGAVFGTLNSPKTAFSVQLASDGALRSTEPALAEADVEHLTQIALQMRRVAERVRHEHRPASAFARAFVSAVLALLNLCGLCCPEPDAAAEADAASHAAIRAHVRSMCGTLWHPMGGAAVGPVLDPSLRLRGAQNVRVAGAAALPIPVRCNPMATCYSMGWRLGELMLA